MNAEISAAWDKVQSMINGFMALLPNIVLALIVFLIFLFIASRIKALVKRLTRNRHSARNLGLVLGRLAQGVTILIGLFIALSIVIPTFRAGDLVQLLGISGVAIGFAFRDILQNFLSGILILLTEPFQIDDQIVFKGFEGTVENIETRATTIRTYDGRRIVIPNSELFTNSVTVNTAFDHRRLEYDVGIGYGDDIDLAKQLMLDALHSIDEVLKDPAPDVLAMELAESTVNIRVRWWIKPPRRADDLSSRDKVISAIKKTLVANGIDLPFPTQQILFHDQTEETDGNRSRQREGWPSGKSEVPKPRGVSDSLRLLAQARSSKDSNGKVDS
ncbi:MscS Mechanosensitive ion channel [Trichormus variabilis ATCC 29413]|uniref:MscS Mechanosensitive ion channel n=2 Tax=Anabaena variabilis TaxID=264691 RepID=Q3MES2_TRIV2|nr:MULTISPECIES: mechanosensitive ion channel family protein [Nostocaceae]ABA20514.1 MscS Mechanosensitive ion channel [Trichormus variabilis ATCC 29413]MBC1214669.1 mechanosensitive ion channel family protein [Trichormus variabilis ARAD]MBC1255309.1 mechanosensitive ion channel family protein [Trichormus variabilis V5]MBC1267013.1 mechanosensitive ion channel family protein [Trichormus variabilis FSR]MBC1300841.1 mechanosensitive ion channel family protein [Trichormus variabilis N2B]